MTKECRWCSCKGIQRVQLQSAKKYRGCTVAAKEYTGGVAAKEYFLMFALIQGIYFSLAVHFFLKKYYRIYWRSCIHKQKQTTVLIYLCRNRMVTECTFTILFYQIIILAEFPLVQTFRKTDDTVQLSISDLVEKRSVHQTV